MIHRTLAPRNIQQWNRTQACKGNILVLEPSPFFHWYCRTGGTIYDISKLLRWKQKNHYGGPWQLKNHQGSWTRRRTSTFVVLQHWSLPMQAPILLTWPGFPSYGSYAVWDGWLGRFLKIYEHLTVGKVWWFNSLRIYGLPETDFLRPENRLSRHHFSGAMLV